MDPMPHLGIPRAEGMKWLAETAGNPTAVLRLWDRGETAALASVGTWRVVEAPLYPSIDALLAIRPTGNLGPVLGSSTDRLAWWLVAAGTATLLDAIPGAVVHPAGWTLDCPAPGVGAGGRTWLHPPYGTGLLTPARLLCAALLDARVMAR
ncbi:hypothetical protein [Streptomyces sp. SPB074]|uniref:hypothetical protein n=1 Tax=Streptomyces sp. (strain SPB074) TaxID=465543 RepID=UPI00017F1036|nr:hypothetical protein [Streptomyces sp. SPB074]EDY43258.1 hypothetical protein SSBG_01220 [Streptomyces sp. SPB074]